MTGTVFNFATTYQQPKQGGWPEIQTPRTVFLDRDGVVNHNREEHVLSYDQFEFLPGVIEALARLHRAGFQVVIVTNQGAVARGLLEVEELNQIHARMLEQIELGGGRVRGVFYCPHSASAGCGCRKPEPGMLFAAAEQFDIDLPQSWLIGDYVTDIEAGLAAGCRPILVKTGRGSQALALWEQQTETRWSASLTVKNNLPEAVDYILSKDFGLIGSDDLHSMA